VALGDDGLSVTVHLTSHSASTTNHACPGICQHPRFYYSAKAIGGVI
jgi:hypothetical protein